MKSLKSDNEFLLFHSLFSFSKTSVKATYFLDTYSMWKSTLKRDHEFCEKIKVFTSNQSKITEMFYLLSTTLKNSQNSIPPPFFTKWITVHSVTHCGKREIMITLIIICVAAFSRFFVKSTLW